MHSSLAPRQETARESPFFGRRLIALGVFGVALLLIIAARVAHLSVFQGEYYRELSDRNKERFLAIPAPRGIIYDRFGRSLVSTQVQYLVALEPDGLTSDTLTRSLRRFEELTGLDPRPPLKDLRAPADPARPIRSRQTYVLASHLPLELAARVDERQEEEMPGLRVEEMFSRSFTDICPPRALSHVIGYTGFPSTDEEVERLTSAGVKINPGMDQIGKRGIERTYDELLRGEKGLEVEMRDALERRVGEPLVLQPARSGADLSLTIDADLQTTASHLLEGHKGAIVALDPNTGEILAMVSKPDFLSYPLQPGDSEWNNTTNNPYPPGSTFKVIVAAAALKAGIDPSTTFVCNKYWQLGDTRFKCLAFHGEMDMRAALRSSCNVYFYNLARQLRWEAIASAAREFGFGERAGLDLYPPDSEGRMIWPPNSRDAQSINGEVVQMAIGQGRLIETTPLQMALAYAAIANPRGLLMTPRLAMADPDDGAGQQNPPLSGVRRGTPASDPRFREILIDGLRMVVESSRGTANKAGFDPEWKVAGKTGSAEPGIDKLEHAWFVGFAPYDAPEICLAIICEESGHGGDIAAPIARNVLKVYFTKTRPKLLEQKAPQHPQQRVALGAP